MPLQVVEDLHNAYQNSAFNNTILFSELKPITQALANAQIPCILLKGAALAPLIYENIAMRPMVDLDLLIHQQDIELALMHLERVGYKTVKVKDHLDHILEYENEIMLTKPGHLTILLELHWNLFDSPYYQSVISTDWLWQSASSQVIDGNPCLILGHSAQILHLSGHLYLHHTGDEILWQNDLAGWIYKFHHVINWDEILSLAKKYNLVQPLQRAISLVQLDYEAPIPLPFIKELQQQSISNTEKRVFRLLNETNRSVAQRFWDDFLLIPGWHMKLRFLWQNLFPSTAYMRQRYQIKKSYQVPFYYFYRWVLGLADMLRYIFIIIVVIYLAIQV